MLTHVDAGGRARMVDVGGKPATRRVAVARAALRMKPATARAIATGSVAKGDVLATARIAGIQAAKRTGELIPLCHPIGLDYVDVRIDVDPRRGRVAIEADHMEARCAKRDKIPTTINVASGLADVRDRSNRCDLAAVDIDHAERRARLHATLHHQSIARLKDVQWKRNAREEDEVQREERDQ